MQKLLEFCSEYKIETEKKIFCFLFLCFDLSPDIKYEFIWTWFNYMHEIISHNICINLIHNSSNLGSFNMREVEFQMYFDSDAEKSKNIYILRKGVNKKKIRGHVP